MPRSEAPDSTVSIVIPTYDEVPRLLALLRSLAGLDAPTTGVQIIVVDDASPDFDPGPVKEAGGRFSVELIRHSTNQGRARARNSGIRAAAGDVVVFLDSDMTVESDFLDWHLAHHRQTEDTVVIGHIRFGPDIEDNRFNRYLDSRGVKRLQPGQEVPFNFFVTGNSSLPRSLLLRAGPFDEDFTAYGGEDLELGYRLHRCGARFAYAPRALSLHHHVRPFASTCDLMYTYGRHSLPLLVDKHPELAGLLRLGHADEPLPRRLLRLVAMQPALYAVLYRLGQWGLRSWTPDLLFSYLVWYRRTRGYFDAVGAQKLKNAQ